MAFFGASPVSESVMQKTELFPLVKGVPVTSLDDAYETGLTAEQAKRVVLKHGASWSDFIADIGEKELFSGKEVLDWLGY